MNKTTVRKVDVSHIEGDNIIDNYMPCLCNGVIVKGLDKSWNPQKWNPEFHIEDKNLVGLVDVTVSYVIYKGEKIVANGKTTYNVSSGEIDSAKFICNIIDKENTSISDVKEFLKNIIVLFGNINYIAKKNATKKKSMKADDSSKISTKKNWIKEKRDVEYQFQTKFEQPPHIPKEKKDIQKRKKKTNKTSQSKTPTQRHRAKKIVYKVETWERAGYYTSRGTYVPPCTIHRHRKTKVS